MNTPSYIVIGYPTLSDADFKWIQSLRKSNDQTYDMIRPHVTFVFPTDKVPPEMLIQHVKSASAGTKSIQITLSKTAVEEDDTHTFFHTFLVPSAGYNEIVALHDHLYTGPLVTELRPDIPYVPHIGLATNSERSITQEIADTAMALGLNIEGTITALTVASYDGAHVTDIATIPLLP